MTVNKTELLAILPQRLRQTPLEDTTELRLRLDRPPRLVTYQGFHDLEGRVDENDLNYILNAACRYSPWNAESLREGYLTAPGGHRIGVCGEGAGETYSKITSLCIRIARDVRGIAKGLPVSESLLILGPPGSGKTTLLRDLIREVSRTQSVSVVDERRELFPTGFQTGKNTDVLSGIPKPRGIDMVLRSMGPQVIAMDEITSEADCAALTRASWCGVQLLATAHAFSVSDLYSRPVYHPLTESGLFSKAVVLDMHRNWHIEEVTP